MGLSRVDHVLISAATLRKGVIVNNDPATLTAMLSAVEAPAPWRWSWLRCASMPSAQALLSPYSCRPPVVHCSLSTSSESSKATAEIGVGQKKIDRALGVLRIDRRLSHLGGE